MSLAIRPLSKTALGRCSLCDAASELYAWDSNLGGRICRECEPYLDAAELALVASKLSHSPDTLDSVTPKSVALAPPLFFYSSSQFNN